MESLLKVVVQHKELERRNCPSLTLMLMSYGDYSGDFKTP